MDKIGQRIKQILKDKKLRQVQLAEGTGIPRSTLSEILSDKKKTSFENMQLIADFLEIDLQQLVKGEKYRQSPASAGQVAEALGAEQYPTIRKGNAGDLNNEKYIPEILEILQSLSEAERRFVLEMAERLKANKE